MKPREWGETGEQVECIVRQGAPTEFGVKVSIATLLTRAPSSQCVAYVATLAGTLMIGTRWPR
jgi:hypothetical protein